MFSALVGSFDWPSMATVVGVAVALAAAFAAWLHRTPYKLQEMKLQNDHDEIRARIAKEQAVAMAQIDQKVITSHRSNAHPDD